MITVLTDIQQAVSDTEVIEWLRLPQGTCSASEVNVINTLAHSGTIALEERLKRKMLHAEVLKEAKDWSPIMGLPWSPFVELIEFTYKDEDGNVQSVDPNLYEILERDLPARINFFDNIKDLPELHKKSTYPIQIKYKVGEAETAGTVPQNYKQVILMAVASGYMNRASLSSKSLQTEAMEHYINQVLKNKRVMRFG